MKHGSEHCGKLEASCAATKLALSATMAPSKDRILSVDPRPELTQLVTMWAQAMFKWIGDGQANAYRPQVKSGLALAGSSARPRGATYGYIATDM